MYSPRIISRQIERAEQQFGIKLKRYDVGSCLDLREKLDELRNEDGKLRRPLTPTERAFITNESLLSKFDFRYWAERYATIERDGVEGGGLGPLHLSESQEIVLTHLARAEDEEWIKADRGETCDGILMLFNKARQMYLTMISRSLLMHRLTFYHNTRGISASVDEDKIKELYDRDKRIYNCGLDKDEYSKKGGLPWWMRPQLNFDVKAGHMNWAVMGSSILYQFSTQGSALGQGRQFDIGHLTECAYWPEDVLQTLRRDLFPTFPQSKSTLLLLESVSFGRSGWWYDLSKACETARLPRWRFCFIPWYCIKKKYRRPPPLAWTPDDITQRHADMVWETSTDYIGLRVKLEREQMYWWETTREEYRQSEQLADFLTNYCATPEEGFQHSNPTAVSHETLSRLHDEARAHRPVPYLLRLEGSRSADDDWTKGKVPTYQIGQDAIVPAHPDELDSDPRGIVWIWEPPRRSATYYLGIDSTNGIIPWNRNIRNEEDYRTDNGAICVMRTPREEGAPDIQVAEYAAPIDQEELGKVANLLGRIYGGSNEDGQAMAITEVHLGMGLPVIRKMMDLGYLNHFAWQHIDKIAVVNTASYGWYASPTSVRLLWEKLRKHLALRRIIIKSQWLVEELGDALWDAQKQTANAASGKHDDRIRALGLCVWAAHMWGTTPELESTEDVKKTETKVDWQRRAVSYEQMQDEMNELVDGWVDG